MEPKTIDALLSEVSELTQEPLKMPPLPDRAEPLDVVLIGQPQQNLFGAADKIFGGLSALDAMMFRSFYCAFAYGEETKFFVEADDMQTQTTAESLIQMLLVMDSAKPAVRCKIEMNCPVLKKIRLSIAASGYDYEDFDALEILSSHDFYLFTLTATALFSACEKKFLNEVLLPNVADATAFLVLNSNLILEKDRNDVDEKLKSFLPADAPIFFVPDADEEKISARLEVWSENLQSLRDKRQARVQKILLDKALTAVNLQIEALTLSNENLDGIVARLTSKSKELPKRQESIFRRARTAYTLKIQMDIVERLTAFNQQLIEKFRDKILQAPNVDELREVLPNQIRDLWKTETDRIQVEIYTSFQELQNDLEGMIEKNLREFLNDEATQNIDFDLAAAMTKRNEAVDKYARPNFFDADSAEFNPTKVAKESNLKTYGVIATGVALALMSHPIVGTALAVFGSRSVKQEQDAQFLAKSKDALIVAAKNMSNELYDEACRWIKDGLAQTDENLSACIAACCQNVMDNLLKALNDQKQIGGDCAQRLDKLNGLKQQLEAFLHD